MPGTTTRRNRIVEGSCWTCRKRRIKCDLAKPSCVRCQNSGDACSYNATAPVKWVGGIALRGRNANPVQQTARKPSTAMISHSGGGGGGDHRCDHPEVLSNCSSPRSPSTNNIMSTVFTICAAPSTKPLEEDGLVLYFTNALFPRFHLGAVTLEADFMGSVVQDDVLRYTVIAIAEAHHCFYSKAISTDAVRSRKLSRQVAIQRLRDGLFSVQTDREAERAFANIVLLCILDGMIEPSDDDNATICHLNGGRALMGQWNSIAHSMLMRTGLHSHLLSFFVTMDLVQAVLSGSKPFFESSTWATFAHHCTWFGRLPSEDRFLELLQVFSNMASLGHIVYTSSGAASMPEEYLQHMVATLAPKAVVLRRMSHEKLDWIKWCSLYELCGVIYLNRALRQRSIDDEEVQAATQAGVAKLVIDPLDGMLAHCTIFPLLVIGAHCTRVQERLAICRALASSASYLSFGSLKLMSEFLTATWAKNDRKAAWWAMFEPVAAKAFLF